MLGRPVILALIALFVVLGSLWISSPGLYYDEVLFLQASYPRDDVPIAYTMHIRGRPVALMLISYLGALKGWVYAPLLRLFPPSAALVRLPMLLAGAAAFALAGVGVFPATSWLHVYFAGAFFRPRYQISLVRPVPLLSVGKPRQLH